MSADFPQADRNRLISNASKALLLLHVPASWQLVEIGGDSDFGLDVLVQLSRDGGVQHAFYIQIKGTESPDFVNGGSAVSYTLKRRTLNLYSNLVQDVMLAVAAVVLDETGKLVPERSTFYWQWMSRELASLRGSPFAIDSSLVKTTTVHLPVDQLLHSRLDVFPHLQQQLEVVRAGFSLEDLLRSSFDQKPAEGGKPALARLIDAAKDRPDQFMALLGLDGAAPSSGLPPEAHAVIALIRSGNTDQAESTLDQLGATGLGDSPGQKAMLLNLRGKIAMQRRKRDDALRLFQEAYSCEPAEEHLLALAETQFLCSVDEGDVEGIRAVRDRLVSAPPSDESLALLTRVHVALKEETEATACVARISAKHQVVSRLVVLASQRQWREAVELAKGAGLDPDISLSDRTAVQLIAARAAWHAATASFSPPDVDAELPLAGPADTDITPANDAWQLCLDCMKGLQSLGWPPNVELIAPTVCGVASALGRQTAALELMKEAAARRPMYAELQLNLELLALSAGDAETALLANRRQPNESEEVRVRRTGLLFQLRQFDECLSTAVGLSRQATLESKHAPMALAMGYAAAHRMGRLMEAGQLEQKLKSQPDWTEFVAFAEFAKLGTLRTSDQRPLEVLRAGLAANTESWLLASNLYSNLNTTNEEQAREAVQIARQLRLRAMLTIDESIQLVSALTTLKRWPEASTEAKVALGRFGPEDRLLAMGAVAEEMLGNTGQALTMLEEAINVGTDRISVTHNYMGLSLRLGRLDSARTAIDRLLSLVSERSERMELLRLSALIYAEAGQPAEAQAAALGVGQLVDRSVEHEEATYINLLMTACRNGPQLSTEEGQQFAERIKSFSETWPESKLFRQLQMPEEFSSLDDLHALLDPIVGNSRARLREFERKERQVRDGTLPAPFILRPGHIIHYVGTAFDLWAIAKISKAADRQFHLGIVGNEAEAQSPDPLRDFPILDLTSLLVLDSLNLLDKLFALFPRIAVPRLTVAYISQQANSILGQRVGGQLARSILSAINKWVNRIEQPSAAEIHKGGMVSEKEIFQEYVGLAKSGKWLVYCDDVIVRILIRAEAPHVNTLNTCDTLSLLDARGIASATEVGGALSLLAQWNATINVADRFLIASLDGALPEGFIGDASRRVELFQNHAPFATLARAIWNPEKSVNDLVMHIAQLLESMLGSGKTDIDSAAAVLATWFIRVRLLQRSADRPWRLICYPVAAALIRMPEEVAWRLVSALKRAVTATVGATNMSMEIESNVVQELGALAAQIFGRNESVAAILLSKLRVAMPTGTSDGDACMSSYLMHLRQGEQRKG